MTTQEIIAELKSLVDKTADQVIDDVHSAAGDLLAASASVRATLYEFYTVSSILFRVEADSGNRDHR